MIATIVQSLARFFTPPMSGPFVGHHLICQDCSTRPPARLLLVYYPSCHDHKLLWLSAYPEKFNALPIIMISHVSRSISTISTMAMNLSLSFSTNIHSLCICSWMHPHVFIINNQQVPWFGITYYLLTFEILASKVSRIREFHFAEPASWKVVTVGSESRNWK